MGWLKYGIHKQVNQQIKSVYRVTSNVRFQLYNSPSVYSYMYSTAFYNFSLDRNF